jgi:glycosyltransferase involved in cell wall biosynthesis
MKRMKILIDEGRALGSVGGIPEYTRSLVDALQNNPTSQESGRSFEVTVKDPGLRSVLPGKLPRLIYLAKLQLLSPVRHAFSGFDVVHFTNFYAPIWKSPSIRYVVTIHDLVIWENPELVPLPKMMVRALRKLAEFGIKKADAVVVPTPSSGDRLVDLLKLDTKKVFVCPNIVKPIFEQRQTNDRDSNLMILVGTISHRKNTTTGVKAFARIAARFPELKLIITGAKGDSYNEVVRLISSLGLKDRVDIKHGLNDAKLVALYEKASLLIVPSRYEGFGIPIIEAMAIGLPVVASSLEVFNEVGGDAVEYFGDPMDVNGLAFKMETLIQDPERLVQMSESGIAEALEYSSANVVGNYHQIYESIGGARAGQD